MAYLLLALSFVWLVAGCIEYRLAKVHADCYDYLADYSAAIYWFCVSIVAAVASVIVGV